VAVQIRKSELYATVDVLVSGEPLPHGSALKRALLHAEDVCGLIEADGAIRLVSNLAEVLFGIHSHRDVGVDIGVQSADRSLILNGSAARQAVYKRWIGDYVRQRRDGRGDGALEAVFTCEFTTAGAARATGYPRWQHPSVCAIHPLLRELLQIRTVGALVSTLRVDERTACQPCPLGGECDKAAENRIVL
jgi:hypothetical protein